MDVFQDPIFPFPAHNHFSTTSRTSCSCFKISRWVIIFLADRQNVVPLSPRMGSRLYIGKVKQTASNTHSCATGKQIKVTRVDAMNQQNPMFMRITSSYKILNPPQNCRTPPLFASRFTVSYFFEQQLECAIEFIASNQH